MPIGWLVFRTIQATFLFFVQLWFLFSGWVNQLVCLLELFVNLLVLATWFSLLSLQFGCKFSLIIFKQINNYFHLLGASAVSLLEILKLVDGFIHSHIPVYSDIQFMLWHKPNWVECLLNALLLIRSSLALTWLIFAHSEMELQSLSMEALKYLLSHIQSNYARNWIGIKLLPHLPPLLVLNLEKMPSIIILKVAITFQSGAMS